MKNILKKHSLVVMALMLITSCGGDYLDTLPSSSISPDEIFIDVSKAKMAINGMARLMVNQYGSDPGYGQLFCGEGTIKFLYGEYPGENFCRGSRGSTRQKEMTMGYLDNNQNSNGGRYIWYYYYTIIGNANEFLSRLHTVEGEPHEIGFLKAQALVYRAYCYEQLVQFFCSRWVDSENGTKKQKLNEGLVLRTVENMYEKDLPLSSSGEIYAKIYEDLDEAIELFSASTMTRDNVWEPNINVAYAVYARAAITRQDYSTAAEMAMKARKGFPLMSNADYIAGFSKSTGEWIWGSYGGDDQILHYYGFHSYMSCDADATQVRSHPVSMSKDLYDKIPPTDIRKEMFLYPEDNSYSKSDGRYNSSNKFAKKVLAEHPTMVSENATFRIVAYHSFKFSLGASGKRGVGFINHFRSSEMYLIEAEAKYFLGNQEDDVRKLMNELTRDTGRDSDYDCTASGEDLLKEIKTYRAIELWGEGFDWLDKKRYNESIVRRSFKNGGNFHVDVAKTISPDYKNGWVYVTPLYESENNAAMN